MVWPWTPTRSTSKPKIVRDCQQKGYTVVFIGDGLSEQEVLGVADGVYAKGILMEIARESGVKVRYFESLNDAVGALEIG